MDIYALARRAIAAGLPGVTEADVRIPARHAAISVYAPEAPLAAAEAFPTVLGVPMVRTVGRQNGWLLFTLTDKFYDACVREICGVLPKPPDDCGSFARNRMLALARQAGEGCPHNAHIRRALWLWLGAAYGYVSKTEAERAFLRMLYPLPVRERMQARRSLGQMADACARLDALSLRGKNDDCESGGK